MVDEPRRESRRLSLAEQVAAVVESDIEVAGRGPGEHLGTKLSLSAAHGVAPATLAEALRLLRERGLVEVRPGPGGGVFTAAPSPMYALAREVVALRHRPSTVNEAVQVLNALDVSVCRDAAEHRTAEDVADLQWAIGDLTAGWSDSADAMRRNWRLHRRIAAVTPNLVLRTFYLNLVDHIESEGFDAAPRERLGVARFEPASPGRLDIHQQLVEAIIAGDLEAAAAAAVAHGHQGDTSA